MAKKSNLPICAICKKEIVGRSHAVFNPSPEYGLIPGIRQCFKCLAESSNRNKLK
jgi:hypothetical protein